MAKKPISWDFRDVSSGIQKIREFLLGRKYVFHHRFPPLIAPRTIPPPEIPRGPDDKYSDYYYGNRNVLNSVNPPVVAPIADGGKSAQGKACLPPKHVAQGLKFPSELPTPGSVWWFDAHCYYEEVFQTPCGPLKPCGPPPSSAPCPCPPPHKEVSVVKTDEKPMKLEPCKSVSIKPELPTPADVCEPCKDVPKKKC